MNSAKTKFIAFSLTISGQPSFSKVTIHSFKCVNICDCSCPTISMENSIKYLGVIVDGFLRWDMQVVFLTKRLKQFYYVFYNLRNIMSDKLLYRVYDAVVGSVLRYGITPWGGMFRTHLKHLEIVQHTILKIIHKVGRLFNTDRLYNETKQLNIKQIFIHETLINQLKKKQSIVEHGQNTRSVQNKNVIVPRFHRTHLQHSLSYYGPKLYCLLPVEMKFNINVKNKKDKRKLKTYIVENSGIFYSVFENMC